MSEAFRIADVRRAIQAVESGGKCVTAVEFFGRDRFRVLTGQPSTAPASEHDADDWVSDAGEKAVQRA